VDVHESSIVPAIIPHRGSVIGSRALFVQAPTTRFLEAFISLFSFLVELFGSTAKLGTFLGRSRQDCVTSSRAIDVSIARGLATSLIVLKKCFSLLLGEWVLQ
jgi:hypothetical protein